MISSALTRWCVPGLLAVGLAVAAVAPMPARAQSNEDLVRVIIDVADVVLRANQPYYRGHYDQPLHVSYDYRGRPTYYRMAPRQVRRGPPAHAPAHGWRAKHGNRARCDRRGRCNVSYYAPRQDRSRGRHWR